jgi:hypothetical protein
LYTSGWLQKYLIYKLNTKGFHLRGIASTLQYDNNAIFCLFLSKWVESACFCYFSKVYAFMGKDAKLCIPGFKEIDH